jgi:hypothetical protein
MGCCSSAVANDSERFLTASWMKMIRDEVTFINVVSPGTHDSACLNCALRCCVDCPCIPIYWLNCTTSTVFEQCLEGVRSFDLRFQESCRGLYIFHGLGRSVISLEQALIDLRRFIETFPTEVLDVTIKTYYDRPIRDPSVATRMIQTVIQDYCIDHSIDPCHCSLSALRGKIILHSVFVNPAYHQPYICCWTYTNATHIGGVSESAKADTLLRDRLDNPNPQDNPLRLNFNRNSGDSLIKRRPLTYMAHDMPFALELLNEVKASPEKRNHVSGADFDFDIAHVAFRRKIISINIDKGLVNPSYTDIFNSLFQ